MLSAGEVFVDLRARLDKFQQDLNRSTQAAQQTANRIDKSFQGVERTFRRLGGVLATVFSAQAARAFSRSMIEAASSLEQLEARLRATTGSQQAAAEAMNFLRSTAQRQSVDLLQLADGYNRLLPAVRANAISLSQAREILGLVNDNMKAFGLTGAEVDRVFFGLSQTLAGGVITTENLNQVTEPLPGLMNALTREMAAAGKITDGTINSLKDYIATGRVMVSDIAGPLIKALQDQQGAAEKLGDTYAAAMARMNNATRDFYEALGSTGILDAFTAAVEGITGALTRASIAITLFGGELKDLNRAQVEFRIEELKEQISELERFGNMPGPARRVEELRRELHELSRMLGTYEQASKDAESQTISTTREIQKNSEASDKFLQVLQKMEQQAIFERNTVGASEYERKLYALRDVVVQNRDAFKALGAEGEKLVASIKHQYRETDLLNRTLEAQERATKEQEEALKDLQEQYNRLAEGIEDAFADAFDSIFSDGIDGFEDFGNRILGMMRRTAAEIAASMVVRPVLGGLGINSPAGGGGGFGGIPGGGSLVGAALGKTAIGGAINAAGASALPGLFGTGAPLAGAVGPTQLGALAGLGVTPITALAGAAAFAIPAILGSFKSKPHPATSFVSGFGAGGDLQISSMLSKHIDDSISQQLSGSVAEIGARLTQLGLNVGGIGVIGGYDVSAKGGGGFLRLGGRDIQFNPKNAAEVENALAELTRTLIDLGQITDGQLAMAMMRLQTEGKTAAEILDEMAAAVQSTISTQYNAVMEQISAQEMLANRSFATANSLRTAADAARASAAGFFELSQTLMDSFTAFQLGDLSALSPAEQLRIAQEQFAGTVAGGLDTASALPGAGRTFLEESRAFYGSSAAFKSSFNTVLDAIQSASSQATARGNAELISAAQLEANAGIFARDGASLQAVAQGIAETNANILALAAQSSTDNYARRI